MPSAGRWVTALACAGALLAGCTGGGPPSGAGSPSPSASPSASQPSATASPTPSPPSSSGPSGPSSPTAAAVPRFDPDRALRDVRFLAGTVGPRQATTPAYRRAARWVQARLRALGWRVQREAFRVPAGVSWGVPVPAGRTWNVVARPPGLAPGDPHVVVGAHLDTVPQAPGAEDNASGVAVVLELARLAAAASPRLPVVLVAYGGEEPRNAVGTAHHFGSLTQVARMSAAERRSLRGMVALDRVGVGRTVPVCTAGIGPGDVRRSLLAAARRAGVPARACAGVNLASDHLSFERAGLPAARVGSTPYAAYHSARDVPGVVEVGQLGRTGRLLWAWLRGP